MLNNFRIENSVGLKGNEFYHDVHNDYSLFKISFSPAQNKTMVFLLRKKEGDWIKEKEPKQLKIEFSGLYYFVVSDDFLADECSINIEEIGFKEPIDNDYDWLVQDEQRESGKEYHIIFSMEDRSYIRIGCSQVNLDEIPIILKIQ